MVAQSVALKAVGLNPTPASVCVEVINDPHTPLLKNPNPAIHKWLE